MEYLQKKKEAKVIIKDDECPSLSLRPLPTAPCQDTAPCHTVSTWTDLF